MMERVVDCVGVSISLVRIVSSGERSAPAMPAAAIAILSDDSGDGLSIMSRPPIPVKAPLLLAPIPGSGRFKIAASVDLVQTSSVLNRSEYRNVTFVPFQMPHAPSRVHDWLKTSVRESDFFKKRRCDG